MLTYVLAMSLTYVEQAMRRDDGDVSQAGICQPKDQSASRIIDHSNSDRLREGSLLPQQCRTYRPREADLEYSMLWIV